MNDEEEEEGGGWTVSDVRALRAMEEEEDDGDDDEERRWVDSDVRQMPHSPDGTSLRGSEPTFEGQWRGLLRHLHCMHCRRQLAKLQSKSMDARTHAHPHTSHKFTICITHTEWAAGHTPHNTQHGTLH
jgi:hypothetical protein